MTIRDEVNAFRTGDGEVVVLFTNYAAQYVVKRDNRQLAAIVAALARSWATKSVAAVVVSGSTIVDVAEE